MKKSSNTIRDTSVKYILFIGLIPLVLTSILYLNISFSTTKEISTEQTREINKQIILNLENYISSLIDTSDYIENQIEKYDSINDLDQLYQSIRQAIELQKDIESIDLYDETGLLILEETDFLPRIVASRSWFLNAINHRSINNFSKVKNENSNSKDDFLALSKYTTYYANNAEKRGVLRIDINFNRINELVNITELGDNGLILFIDEKDEIIYSSAGKSIDYNMDEIKDQVLGESTTKVNGDSMFVSINTITNTRWRMVTFLNRNILVETRVRIMIYFLIILMISALLAILFSLRLSRKMTQPLERLKNVLLTVEPRDLNLTIHDDDYEEMRVLNETINHMSFRINKLMHSVIKEQEEKAELELDILQHQINPHFLYNTLDTIVVLSENDKKQEVIDTIIALSRYFRFNISVGNKYIPINQEIEQIENYLKIQKVRYQTRFDYKILVNPTICDYEVLKLLLQPLVENAIYHGTSANEDSHILINHEIIEDYYYFHVMNSGYGLTDEQVEVIHTLIKTKSQSKNVGLRNVYNRLKLYYGEEADLYFEVLELDDDIYTKVTIKIPLDQLKEI